MKLARSLASKAYEDELVRVDVSIALLNAEFVLLKKKEPLKVQKLLNVVEQLNFADSNILVQVRINYIKILLKYIFDQNEYIVDKYIDNMTNSKLKSDFEFVFQQVKDIYGSSTK